MKNLNNIRARAGAHVFSLCGGKSLSSMGALEVKRMAEAVQEKDW